MTKKRKSSEELKEETVTRKANELSILCGIDVCMISYGVNGEIKIFPEDQQRVAAMASRFMKLTEASRSKKRSSLDHVLKDIQSQKTTAKKQKKEDKVVTVDQNLGSQFDSYSIDELKMKLESIGRKFQTIYEWRENMNEFNHGNFDPVLQSVKAIAKAPLTPVQISERKKIFDEETTVCQKVCQVRKQKIDHRIIASSTPSSSSSSALELGFQITKKRDNENIASSSSSLSQPDLGFENSKKIDYENMTSLSSPPDLGFQSSNYGNIASSPSSISAAEPSFPPDLVFGSSNSNNIFDNIGEDDEFPLPPDFGFIDLKEVDYMLEHYHVEEESWNQETFDQHNNNDIQIQHHT